MIPVEDVRKVFAGDRFATDNGAEIMEADINYAKCRMEVTPAARNARGAVMGGAIYTLADFAFAVASNVGRTAAVTLDSQITFIRSTDGNWLFAEARCEKDGRRVCCYDIRVTDDQGHLIAVVRSTGMRVGKEPIHPSLMERAEELEEKSEI